MSAAASHLGFFPDSPKRLGSSTLVASVHQEEINKILDALKAKYQAEEVTLNWELAENTKAKQANSEVGNQNLKKLCANTNTYVQARALGVAETAEDVQVKAEQAQAFWAAIHTSAQQVKTAIANIESIERNLKTVNTIIEKLNNLERTLNQKATAELKAIKEVMQAIQSIESLQAKMKSEVEEAPIEAILSDMCQLKADIEALQAVRTESSELKEVIDAFRTIYEAELPELNLAIAEADLEQPLFAHSTDSDLESSSHGTEEMAYSSNSDSDDASYRSRSPSPRPR